MKSNTREQQMTRTKEIWEKVSEMNISQQFTLGPINTESILKDPKHLAFSLSRYKFSAKMMHKCGHILEIGCGEGIGAFMFLAETAAMVTAIDFDQSQIDYAREPVHPHGRDRLTFDCQDILTTPYAGDLVDGLVSLDVIEHIDPSEEHQFFTNAVAVLEEGGIAVIGTPNKYAERFASKRSQVGHINLFEPERLVSTLESYFRHVFLFSMNDEMVHTGYSKTAHYLMALCVK